MPELRAILIDPRQQKITEIKIPLNRDAQHIRNVISRSIGSASFYWIDCETKVAICEAAAGAAFFQITASPPICFPR